MDDNQVLIEYLGNRSMPESDINKLKGYVNKISFICKFNKDKLKTLLNKLSETFFYDSFDKNIIAYNRINDRVDEYFSRQKNTNYDYKKIISIIKYQYIVYCKYTKLLGILTKEDKDISETHVDISNVYKTSKSKEYIKRISKEYMYK